MNNNVMQRPSESGYSTQEVLSFLSAKLRHLEDLTELVERDDDQYLGGGSFGEVYRGRWKGQPYGKIDYPPLAIKVFRSTSSPDPKSLSRSFKVGISIMTRVVRA